MGKFTGVLLVSDYDNTLVDTERARHGNGEPPRVSDRNREALEYFMGQGGRFAVATGRALPALEGFADQIPMNAPSVVCNGAALYDFSVRQYLDHIPLDAAVSGCCQEALERFPTVAVEIYPLLESVIYAFRPNQYTRQHEGLTRTEAREVASLLEVPQPLTKILFEDDRDTLEALAAHLRGQPWIHGCELVFSTAFLLELTGRGANKGGMVRRLADRLGIAPEHIYCVGDEANDLPMLRMAAQGFAPANCSPAVRESGAEIVADCAHDALADVVERLEKKYG